MNLTRKELLARFQPLAALAAIIIGLSLMALITGSWNNVFAFWRDFLTVKNSLTVLQQISINVCLSIGMTFVIVSGGIDLSVGSVLAFSGAVAAGLLRDGLSLTPLGVHLQFTPGGAMLVGILVGLACGWFNGWTITRLRLPPFVATLGMLSIARGLTRLWTKGHTIGDLGPVFAFTGAGSWLHVPVVVLVSAVLVALFYFLSRQTTLGRYIYAVGGSERASAFSGLNVKRIKVQVYVLAGALAGVAGLLHTARVTSATPDAAVGYELDSIAAVVIGGTSLSGGRGSVLGTVLGCLIIGVLNSGLVQLGVPPSWQLVVKGLVIIAAVAVDQMSGQRGGRPE
jgi:ribose transport system permease protein